LSIRYHLKDDHGRET